MHQKYDHYLISEEKYYYTESISKNIYNIKEKIWHVIDYLEFISNYIYNLEYIGDISDSDSIH